MSQSPTEYGYGQAPQAQRPTETMAILALVFAFVFAPLGIVFGVIGRKNIARNGNNGRGLATAGMWLGIVFTAFIALYIVGLIALFAASMSNAAAGY